MNRKVTRLVSLVDEGFALRAVQPSRQGAVRLEVGRGPDRRCFDFAFYEVPALLQATRPTGHGA